EGRTLDVGFGAEAVAEIEPLLITRNDKGEVEGVKYDRLSVVFVNAFKEQQAKLQTQARRIATQQQQLKQLKQELDALHKLVCATHPQAVFGQEKPNMGSRFIPGLIWQMLAASATFAQPPAFSYQGKLTDSGSPANGNYDLQFKLFDALSAGSQQGAALVR